MAGATSRPRAALLLVHAALLSSIVFAQRGTAPPPASGRGASADAGAASLSGSVVSESGQPLANLAVRVLARTMSPLDPGTRYIVHATARTDARGEYRFTALPPGDYIVDLPLTQVTLPASATSPASRGRGAGSDARAARLGDSFGPLPYLAGATIGSFRFQTMTPFGAAPHPRPPVAGNVSVYPATFLASADSGAFNIARARVVTLRAGDASRGDIRLTAVVGRRVSGRLTGPADEVAHLGVRLLPVLADQELFRDGDFELATTATDDRGAFTFLGVPPGRYTLKVLYVPSNLPGSTAPPGGLVTTAPRVGVRGGGAPTAEVMALVRWAETIVNVGDADVPEIAVELRPALRVAGKIEVEGDPARADFAGMTIAMYSNRPVTIAPPYPVAVSADGTFTAHLYGPGKYRAQVSGAAGLTTTGFVSGTSDPVRWLDVAQEGIADARVAVAPAPARGAAPTLSLTSAPPQPPSPDNGFIAGRVVEGDTGIPVAGATIVLQQVGTPVNARRVATTDAAGSFTFGEAVAGSYTVTATAPGYAPSGFGKLRDQGLTRNLGLAARERVGNMLIRIWKPGSIAGRVTDERGNPVTRLMVVAIQVTESGTERTYTVRTPARTDTTGRYNFSNLPSGRYIVCASFTPTTIPDAVQEKLRQETATGRGVGPFQAFLGESRAPAPATTSVLVGTSRFFMGSPDSTPAPMPAPVSADGVISSYRRTCHPGTAALPESTVLSLHAGEGLFSIDLRLSASPTTRITGAVRGPAGPLPHMGLHLIHEGDDAAVIVGSERLDAAAGVTDAAGNFTLLGVTPGRYRLRAWTVHVDGRTPSLLLPVSRPGVAPQGVTLWADVPVAVPATGTLDLPLTPAPTARVSGRIVFDGTGTPPSAAQFTLALQSPPLRFDPPAPSSRPASADGPFLLHGYPPGRYGLPNVTVSGWRITSATLEGKPVPGHAIQLGTRDIGNLVLTATDRFTTLTGTVTPEPGLGPIGANVYIFPADYRSWIADGMTATRMRFFRPTGAWRYTATWLPPGDYLAVVFREVDADDMTPSFVERLAPLATKVTLKEGQVVTLDLGVSSMR